MECNESDDSMEYNSEKMAVARRAGRGGDLELDQGIITKEVTRFRSAGYIAMIG